MARTVVVRLPRGGDRSYSILIEPGVLRRLPGLLARRWRGSAVFVVTDSNVGPLYARRVLRDLHRAGLDAIVVDFPAGEKSKSPDVYHSLVSVLLENNIRRGSVLVALGGGVVGDLAGFAAATVLRGVPFVQVPTTLLAQVDSSVGGKVGIDHALGKNLIGAFHQPSAVLIDPALLKTLPRAEFRNGMAEVLKIAVALDAGFFRLLERNARAMTPAHMPLISRVIARSVALKAAVVARDERESGLRKALNLGHTLGHAVEAATSYRLRHGEAVAIGMLLEGRIAVTLGLLDVRDLLRMQRVMDAAGLSARLPAELDMNRLLSALALDKKGQIGAPLFVLPRGMGRCAIDVPVPPQLIRSVLT